MTDLKYWPQDLVSFFALMGSVLRILHLVAKFQQGVFDIVESIWWRLAVAG
jgi:hypothetical protein